VKWTRRHVRAWAKEVLGFNDADTELVSGWSGSQLASVKADGVPAALSEAAALLLLSTITTLNWSRLRGVVRRLLVADLIA
jgi:hypothetical protein